MAAARAAPLTAARPAHARGRGPADGRRARRGRAQPRRPRPGRARCSPGVRGRSRRVQRRRRGRTAQEPMNMPTPSVTKAMKPCAAARRSASRLLIDVDLSGDEEEVVADAVQQDAGVEHPHQRARCRRTRTARSAPPTPPCRRAASSSRRAARRTTASASMKPISDIWPSVILPAGVRHADLVQERVGERVVELQRDADQERAEHEDRERAVPQQLQRVEARARRAASTACPAACGGVCGSTKREQAEHERARRPRSASARRSPRARACR